MRCAVPMNPMRPVASEEIFWCSISRPDAKRGEKQDFRVAASRCAPVTKGLLVDGETQEPHDHSCRTPSVLEVKSGTGHTVKALVEEGSDLRDRGRESRTAPVLVAEAHNEEMPVGLLLAGVDPEETGSLRRDAIMYAARDGGLRLIDHLLDTETASRAVDSDGNAALDHARIGGSKEMVQLQTVVLGRMAQDQPPTPHQTTRERHYRSLRPREDR